MPIIKYSVERWRGTHPQVITGRGGGIHPDMRPALLLGFCFIAALVLSLIWLRLRAQQMHERIAVLQDEAASRGLLADE